MHPVYKKFQEPYLQINLIFLLLILAVFGYSLAFSPDRAMHPIPSSSKIIGGSNTASTGMSRAFSAIIRLDFDKARAYNPHGPGVFLFFLLQFLLRIIYILAHLFLRKFNIRFTVWIDSLISIGTFVYFFEPFWIELFYK